MTRYSLAGRFTLADARPLIGTTVDITAQEGDEEYDGLTEYWATVTGVAGRDSDWLVVATPTLPEHRIMFDDIRTVG